MPDYELGSSLCIVLERGSSGADAWQAVLANKNLSESVTLPGLSYKSFSHPFFTAACSKAQALNARRNQELLTRYKLEVLKDKLFSCEIGCFDEHQSLRLNNLFLSFQYCTSTCISWSQRYTIEDAQSQTPPSVLLCVCAPGVCIARLYCLYGLYKRWSEVWIGVIKYGSLLQRAAYDTTSVWRIKVATGPQQMSHIMCTWSDFC